MSNVHKHRSKISHDLYQTRLYRVWANMKKRCNKPNAYQYHRYGGRGITYDPKWETFSGFYVDMHETYNPNFQLDRIDNDGNYSKENCRWVTPKVNSLNRSQTHLWEYGGEKLTAIDWSRKIGIKYSTLSMRLWAYGWSIDKAIETPVRGIKL
jgi:hypothetical protein